MMKMRIRRRNGAKRTKNIYKKNIKKEMEQKKRRNRRCDEKEEEEKTN